MFANEYTIKLGDKTLEAGFSLLGQHGISHAFKPIHIYRYSRDNSVI